MIVLRRLSVLVDGGREICIGWQIRRGVVLSGVCVLCASLWIFIRVSRYCFVYFRVMLACRSRCRAGNWPIRGFLRCGDFDVPGEICSVVPSSRVIGIAIDSIEVELFVMFVVLLFVSLCVGVGVLVCISSSP